MAAATLFVAGWIAIASEPGPDANGKDSASPA